MPTIPLSRRNNRGLNPNDTRLMDKKLIENIQNMLNMGGLWEPGRSQARQWQEASNVYYNRGAPASHPNIQPPVRSRNYTPEEVRRWLHDEVEQGLYVLGPDYPEGHRGHTGRHGTLAIRANRPNREFLENIRRKARRNAGYNSNNGVNTSNNNGTNNYNIMSGTSGHNTNNWNEGTLTEAGAIARRARHNARTPETIARRAARAARREAEENNAPPQINWGNWRGVRGNKNNTGAFYNNNKLKNIKKYNFTNHIGMGVYTRNQLNNGLYFDANATGNSGRMLFMTNSLNKLLNSNLPNLQGRNPYTKQPMRPRLLPQEIRNAINLAMKNRENYAKKKAISKLPNNATANMIANKARNIYNN